MVDLSEAFRTPKHLVATLLQTSEYYGLIFYGQGGVGKTVCALDVIHHSMKVNDYAYQNGYTTPLALYEFLYTNRDKKVIILDDVEGIFSNKLSVSILKGALWEADGKREVHYTSTSSTLDNRMLPYHFPMKAKLIILCNEIPRIDTPDVKALLSRLITYEMGFSYKEKLEISRAFLEKDKTLTVKQKRDVEKILKDQTSIAMNDFSFRTLRKAIAFVKYNPKEATELFAATTDLDEVKASYLAVRKKYPTVSQEVSMFMQATGKSRATYFRIKQEVEKELR